MENICTFAKLKIAQKSPENYKIWSAYLDLMQLFSIVYQSLHLPLFYKDKLENN